MASTAAPWIRVPHPKAILVLSKAFRNSGLSATSARSLAAVLASNSLEGVPSHGLHFFEYFRRNLASGRIKAGVAPRRISGSRGAWERWDGRQAPGPLNALFSARRATALAARHGVGVVALQNTNHWTRAATYGQVAARAGFGFICWTNTPRVMPYWGGKVPAVGNNPIVLAFPNGARPIVLDMALSTYSMGRLQTTRLRGQRLPFPGGFDGQGRLSRDPGAILKSQRHLPIGYWKGSGMALLLDLLAAGLSGGGSTGEWSGKPNKDDVSQVYIAFDLRGQRSPRNPRRLALGALADLGQHMPRGLKQLHSPGAGALEHRRRNLKSGIPVTRRAWEGIVKAAESGPGVR